MNRFLLLAGLVAVAFAAPAPSADKCQVCRDLVTVAELFVKYEGWNATDVLNGADTICHWLGNYAEECRSIINSGGLPLAQCITTGGNTTECCKDVPILDICTSAVAAPALTECQVCQEFATIAELFVKYEGWNASQIISEADKICKLLPSPYNLTCKAIVAIGGEKFAECIVGGTNVTQCCDAIDPKICPGAAPKAPSPCEICEEVASIAEIFVKYENWNATQIIDGVDKLCGFLGPVAAECKSIVQVGGLPLAECLAAQNSTQQCCQDIPDLHICTAKAAPEVTTCQICKDFVAAAEIVVKKENLTAAELLADADKICGLLGTYAAECKTIINAGGLGFATCIVGQTSNATACCAAIPGLKICSAPPARRARPAVPRITTVKPAITDCQICQDVATVAELFVKYEGWNASQILNKTEELCNFLPAAAKATCELILSTGGMKLATCIATSGNVTTCCEDIPGMKVCTFADAPAAVPTCQICKDTVEAAQLLVKFEGWNATQLLAEADKVCKIVGGSAEKECETIINLGGTNFAECICAQTNGTVCCQQIPGLNLCKNVAAPIPIALPRVHAAPALKKKAIRIGA